MPTLLRVGPYRFSFCANEGQEAPRVHVYAAENEAKYWLIPMSLAKSKGFRSDELAKIETIILKHRCSSWRSGMTSTIALDKRPENVTIDRDKLLVRMSDGSEVSTSLAKYPRLCDASNEQRQRWDWVGNRSGIHWPEIDEDLSIHGMVRDAQIQQDAMRRIPFAIADLMRITEELNRLFPGRKFTPDGHLIGSIGEVVAQYIYDLKLETCSNPSFDATTDDGRTVQIKLTGKTGTAYGMRWSDDALAPTPDLLLALKLDHQGFREIDNGAFPVDLLRGRKVQKNGQVGVSLRTLAARNSKMLSQVRSLEEFNGLFEYELDSAA